MQPLLCVSANRLWIPAAALLGWLLINGQRWHLLARNVGRALNWAPDITMAAAARLAFCVFTKKNQRQGSLSTRSRALIVTLNPVGHLALQPLGSLTHAKARALTPHAPVLPMPGRCEQAEGLQQALLTALAPVDNAYML